MSIDINNTTSMMTKPLTSKEVSYLLGKAGSPDKLNLSGQNLRGIDLTDFDLTGINLQRADLVGADLRRANLSRAILYEAILREAILSEANLNEADLRGANLSEAILSGAKLDGANLDGAILSGAKLINADLHEANLSEANLYKANLHGANLGKAVLHRATLIQTILNEADLTWADLAEANLSEANLYKAELEGAILYEALLREASLSEASLSEADLRGADLVNATLIGTNLHGANLRGADLRGANLDGADLREAYLSEREAVQLHDTGAIGLDQIKALDIEVDSSSILHIRIVEEPLTTQNFAVIITALSELHTKCWLIQQNRLTDLIDYTQPHNPHLSEETPLIISKMSHNSPADIQLKTDVKVDTSPQGIIEALRIGIDGVAQASLRFKATKQEIQDKELEMKLKEQHALSELADKAQTRQIEADRAELEKRKTVLEIERLQVTLQKDRLEVETMRVSYALETANKMVDILYPDIDAQMRAIVLRILLPDLLQLGNTNGLELALPAPSSN